MCRRLTCSNSSIVLNRDATPALLSPTDLKAIPEPHTDLHACSMQCSINSPDPGCHLQPQKRERHTHTHTDLKLYFSNHSQHPEKAQTAGRPPHPPGIATTKPRVKECEHVWCITPCLVYSHYMTVSVQLCRSAVLIHAVANKGPTTIAVLCTAKLTAASQALSLCSPS